MQVGGRPRRSGRSAATTSTRGVRVEDRGEDRERRHDRGEMVAVERGLEHEHERGHDRPRRDHDRRRSRRRVRFGSCRRSSARPRCDDGRDRARSSDRAHHEEVAAPQRRRGASGAARPSRSADRRRCCTRSTAARRGRGPTGSADANHTHDRGADRGREMVDAAARPQPPADGQRGGQDQRFHRERRAHHHAGDERAPESGIVAVHERGPHRAHDRARRPGRRR